MKAVMYHYVRPDSPEFPHFRHLHIDDFKAQLDYFEKEYGFVKREDFLNAFSGGDLPSGVILTFDDGLADHYATVLPELQKRGLWGIFYVPTGPHMNGKMLSVHRTHILLGAFGGKAILEKTREAIADEMLVHERREDFRTLTYTSQNNDEAAALVKRILNYYLGSEYRDTVLDSLMSAFFPDEPSRFAHFYLSPSEMKEMQGAGMILGSHGISHRVMSALPAAEQEKEIGDSFAFLEKTLGTLPVKTYCHPYGGAYSYNDNTLNILSKEKCLFSFDVNPRDITAEDCAEHPQTLPRYDCNQFPHGTVRALAASTA